MESFAETINSIKSLMAMIETATHAEVMEIADEIYDIVECVDTGSAVLDNLIYNTIIHTGVYKDGIWHMCLKQGDIKNGLRELSSKIDILEDVLNGSDSKIVVKFDHPWTTIALIGTTKVEIEQSKENMDVLENRMNNLEDMMRQMGDEMAELRKKVSGRYNYKKYILDAGKKVLRYVRRG